MITFCRDYKVLLKTGS